MNPGKFMEFSRLLVSLTNQKQIQRQCPPQDRRHILMHVGSVMGQPNLPGLMQSHCQTDLRPLPMGQTVLKTRGVSFPGHQVRIPPVGTLGNLPMGVAVSGLNLQRQ